VFDSSAFGSSPTLAPISISPNPPYYPGDRIHVSWTLTNFGDVDVIDARVRFCLSAGLRIASGDGAQPLHIAGSEAPLEFFYHPDESVDVTLAIKSLAHGESRVFAFEANIADVVSESVSVRAELHACDGTVYHAPVVPIDVRAIGVLHVSALEPVGSGEGWCEVTLSLTNESSSREPSVDVLFCEQDGITLNVHSERPVTVAHEHGCLRVHADDVAPHESVRITVRAELEEEYSSTIVFFDGVVVESQNHGRLLVDPLSVQVPSSADFSSSHIGLDALDDGKLRVGERVTVRLDCTSSARDDRYDVPVAIELPPVLAYVPGSLRCNDLPMPDTSPSTLSLPLVRAHGTAALTLDATLVGPVQDGEELTVGARIGETTLAPVHLRARCAPAFDARDNFISADGLPIIATDRDARVMLALHNRGTASSGPLRVKVWCGDLRLQDARVGVRADDGGFLAMDEPSTPMSIVTPEGTAWILDVPPMAPQQRRVLAMTLRAPAIFDDRTTFSLRATLTSDAGELALGNLTLTGRSFPRIAPDSALACADTQPVRSGETRAITLRVRNEGSQTAERLTLSFELPPELAIERVIGARLEHAPDADVADRRARITIDEIAPCTTLEALLAVRAMHTPPGDGVLTIRAVLDGKDISRTVLAPLRLQTISRPFLDALVARIEPFDDDTVLVSLAMRNVGDGDANNVRITAQMLEGYVPASTAVDATAYGDIRSNSPLAYGFGLPPIAPGKKVEISYRVRPRSTDALRASFVVSADGQVHTVQSEEFQPRIALRFLPVRVQQTPVDVEAAASGQAPSLPPVPRETPVEPNTESMPLPVVDDAAGEHESVAPTPRADAIEPLADVGDVEPAQNASTDAHTDDAINDALHQAATANDEHNAVAIADGSVGEDLNDAADTHAVDEEPPAEGRLMLQQHAPATDEATGEQPADAAASDEPGSDRSAMATALASLPPGQGAEEHGDKQTPFETELAQTLGLGPDALQTIADTYAPIFTLTLSTDLIERIVNVGVHLFYDDRLGTYRHVIGARLLFPDAIDNASDNVRAAFEVMKEEVEDTFGSLLAKTRMPNFRITSAWSEGLVSGRLSNAAKTILRETYAGVRREAKVERRSVRDVDFFGFLSFEETELFAEAMDRLDEISLLYVTYAIVPLLIPSHSNRYTLTADCIDTYRRSLVRTFLSIMKDDDYKRESRMRAPTEQLDNELRLLIKEISTEIRRVA
jgi:hypothetical protein